MINTTSTKSINLLDQLFIFFVLILGIIWQGGSLFWFAPAAGSATLLLTYYLFITYKKTIIKPTGLTPLLIIAFSSWCLVTIFWSPVFIVSTIKAISILALPYGFFLYFLTNSHPNNWSKIWFSIITVGTVLVIYSFIEVYLGQNTPNSLFLNKNTHSTYLNLIIMPTAAYFLLSKEKRTSLILGISFLLLTISQALPGSRGASLGQLMALALLLIISWPSIPKLKIIQLSTLYISATTIAFFVTNNLFRFFAYKIEDTDLGRYEIWEGSLNLFANTPWYGNGVDTYWLMHPAYSHINDPSAGQNAHNDYLQFLIEGGYPALILLLAIIVSIATIWFKTFKNPVLKSAIKIEATAIFGALFAIGLHSFFSYNLSVFSILFLSGLLTARLVFLATSAQYITLSHILNIKPLLFKVSLSIFSVFAISYISSISLSSHFHNKALIEFNENNNVSQTDFYNNLSITINPYDDRPYLLYVQVYQSILSLIKELPLDKKRYYLSLAMEYLDKAEKLNPHRNNTFLLRAKIIEENQKLFSGNSFQQIKINYKQAIKIDPRSISSSINYAQFLISNKLDKEATKVIFDSVKRYHSPLTPQIIELYHFAQKLLIKTPNSDQELLLNNKIKLIKQYYQKKQIPLPKNFL